MFEPFACEPARSFAREFMAELQARRSIFDFKGMFGVLVCRDKEGKDVVLRAFSGQYNSLWNYQGFVPALVDQLQYDKAVEGNDAQIHVLSQAVPGETPLQRDARNAKRIELCNETLSKIYSLYHFTCADGVVRDFEFIVQDIQYNAYAEKQKLLPTGTGDCCAPKLLSYAFANGLVPYSMAEFYWGPSNTHFVQGEFYPPCDEKCGFILPVILGLKILYRDDNIIVVNKPSGLLAVPGRGPEKQDCVVNRVRRLYPDCIEQPSVHRLDMDTSGLMVLAFDAESQRNLSIQFQDGKVDKKYIAVIDGLLCNEESGIKASDDQGRIELKFRLDVDNRPHQIYDEVYGKLGITLWKRLRVWKMRGKTVTSIEFEPLTGRTHQLRLAASHKKGFGIPIVGDNLYGQQEEGQRLLLHSCYLKFAHPVTGEPMEFTCEPDFRY
ncbi:MAG: RluA family pseudouridine synthase [Treponema sp.]|nr:RluA family pseudouridine synthase [Treponema sp.]